MKQALLEAVRAAQADHRPVAVITELQTGRQGALTDRETFGELELDAALRTHVLAALEADQSGRVEGAEGLFVRVYNPPYRLVLVGAVHISQPLATMARLAGYRVLVVDPRRAFASDARFPGVEVSRDWPDEALEKSRLDRRTAVVTLTHDPKLDDPALSVALKSEAFYVGCLGSKKTHAARLGRLEAAGFSAETIARLRGPVGLAIGARSPAEIAVSILAELIRERRRPEPR